MGSVSKEKISPNVNMGILLSLEQKASMGDRKAEAQGHAGHKGLIRQLKWAHEAKERHGALFEVIRAWHPCRTELRC